MRIAVSFAGGPSGFLSATGSLLHTAEPIQTDGVDGPLTASACQDGGRLRSPGTGAIHERDYNDWAGSGQARVSGPGHRCDRGGRVAQATAARPSARVLCRLAAVSDRSGSLRDGTPLGA